MKSLAMARGDVNAQLQELSSALILVGNHVGANLLGLAILLRKWKAHEEKTRRLPPRFA